MSNTGKDSRDSGDSGDIVISSLFMKTHLLSNTYNSPDGVYEW
jgi:hypothetical protein